MVSTPRFPHRRSRRRPDLARRDGPASIALAEDEGTWKAHVDTTKDDLTKAPKLDYSKLKK
ncbi:hypothetical protein [Ensifer sp. 4252]|uniref:hypothetical protein n=1 Tax=Ensifer sp. 4252 TaxID=3373915 RepID=UPI003D2335CA